MDFASSTHLQQFNGFQQFQIVQLAPHQDRTNQWGAQNLWGSKMFDFRRLTLFCSEKRLSMHKMTIFSKHFAGGMAPLPPPGYAYGTNQDRKCNHFTWSLVNLWAAFP